MSRNDLNVASLFALLGLDTSEFDESLRQSKVNLEAIRGPIQDVYALLVKLGTVLGPEAAISALKQLDSESKAASYSLNILKGSLLEIQRIKSGNAALEPRELISLENTDIVDKLRANAERKSAAAQTKSIQDQEALDAKARAASRKATLEGELAEEQAHADQISGMRTMYAAEERAGAKAQAAALRAEMKGIATARRSELQADAAQEAIIRKEGIALNKQLTAEEVASIKAEAAAKKAAYDAETESTNLALKNQVAAIKTERAALLAAERAAQRAAANVAAGGIGFRGTAVEIQAADRLLGISIPRGLTSILARLPEVQSAMSKAFSVFVVIAFIEILDQVHTKINELIDDWAGFSKANMKAWQEADAGAKQARKALLEYHDELRKQDSLVPTGPDRVSKRHAVRGAGIEGDIEERRQVVEAMKEESLAEQDLIEKAKGLNEKIGIIANPSKIAQIVTGVSIIPGKPQQAEALSKLIDMHMTLSDYEEKHRGKLKEINDLLAEVGKLEGKAREERLKSEAAIVSSHEKQKRMQDAVHELPYRLPWFMGPSSSDNFLNDMSGVGSTPSWYQPYLHQGGRNTRGSVASMFGGESASMPMQALMPQGQGGPPTNGGATIAGGGGGGSSPSIQYTYAPKIEFNGVPADIRGFVRDELEPMLKKDFDGNIAGITASITDSLRKWGARV